MTISDISNHVIKAKKVLQNDQVMDCFAELAPLLKELHEWWAINRQTELLDLYKQMVRYLLKGVNDPLQQAIYDRFKNDIYCLIDDVEQTLKTRNSSLFEYENKRYNAYSSSFTSDTLIPDFVKFAERKLLTDEIKDDVDSQENDLKNVLLYESKLHDLFIHFFISDRLPDDELLFIQQFMANEKIERIPKALLISAISMSLIREFDANKLVWLIDATLLETDELRQRALIGLLLVMSMYHERIMLLPVLKARLEKLSESAEYCEELENVYLQLVRTSETASITQRVKEELLPEMIKLGPKLKDKIQSDYSHYNDEMEKKNPEWESIIDDNGISDKIKEFGELQMQGADVYVSTFAPLKSFPFFSKISSWFMPFDVDNSNVRGLFKAHNSLIKAFIKSPFLCNSDKYSFCLSLQQMPEVQQNMMGEAFKDETEQLNEMIKDEHVLDNKNIVKNLSNQYIQDLYRFYTLFPRHEQFRNPLPRVLKFYSCDLFSFFFKTKEQRRRIAEFYFSKNLYVESLDQFLALIENDEVSYATYQKIGFCYQQLHRFKEAIEYYRKAELLDTTNKWTLARIGYCYRRLGFYEEALIVYKQMEQLDPEQLSYQNSAAACLYELGRYEEALSIFFKIDYFKPNTPSVLRLIAWCSFLVGKYEQSWKYYHKIMELKPEAVDYLNMGHLYWVENKLTEAHHAYLVSMKLYGDVETFKKYFMQDAKWLESKDIHIWSMNLMLDALRLYSEAEDI